MKITEAEIIEVLEASRSHLEPENTYTVNELARMWGKNPTTVRRSLLQLVDCGMVQRVTLYRTDISDRIQQVIGYTFKGNGDATQGTSD